MLVRAQESNTIPRGRVTVVKFANILWNWLYMSTKSTHVVHSAVYDQVTVFDATADPCPSGISNHFLYHPICLQTRAGLKPECSEPSKLSQTPFLFLTSGLHLVAAQRQSFCPG